MADTGVIKFIRLSFGRLLYSRVSDPHFFLRIRAKIFMRIRIRFRIRIRILGVSGGRAGGKGKNEYFFELILDSVDS